MLKSMLGPTFGSVCSRSACMWAARNRRMIRPANEIFGTRLFVYHGQAGANLVSINGSKLRYYSSSLPQREEDEQKRRPPPTQRSLPRLMDFPEVLWPSTLNSIKNWFLVQFVIRPYLDNEFTTRNFIFGAKHAIQVISSKLVNGDFSELNNLLTSTAIDELKPIIQKLSVAQRRELAIRESDIYLTFPYQVGIIFDESNSMVQKRWVEITMVFHVLRGLSEMRERGDEIPWNMGTLPEYQDKVFICNYRFIKEFTTGQESDWTVNIVNHFKPIDLLRE